MSRDNNPIGIVISPPGFNYVWDLTQLQQDAQYITEYKAASQGSQGNNLPDATLFAVLVSGNDAYYKVTANTFEMVAENGLLTAGNNFTGLIKYNPPLVERQAPLNFFDIRQQSISQINNIPLEQLSASFLNSIGNPDEVRLHVSINRQEVINASGTLNIPGGSFEVLRQKNTVYNEIRMVAKVPLVDWVDVTAMAGINGYHIGIDTTVNYQFFSNDSKEPIAILYAQDYWNDLTISMADFKTIGSTLPVNLLSFSAINDNNINSLTWKTVTETNSSSYEVERNIDGRNFVKIGSVKSLNRATGASYRYDDNISNSNLKRVQYRLKIIDKDERFQYSKVISLNVGNAKGKILLLGTVTGKNITVITPANLLSKPIQADLINPSGVLIKRITISNESSLIDLTNVSAGTYFVRFTQGGRIIQTETLVKQ
ncbi:MAG: T9SS type A sorting domain-containing protein [Flavitalea sp.]